MDLYERYLLRASSLEGGNDRSRIRCRRNAKKNVFSMGKWFQPSPTGKPGTKIVPEVGSTLRQRADLLFSLVSQSLAAG